MDYTILDDIYNSDIDLFNEIMSEIYYNKMFNKIWK